jgi:hypothetical protein
MANSYLGLKWGWSLHVPDRRHVSASARNHHDEILTRLLKDFSMSVEVTLMSVRLERLDADPALFNPDSGRLDAARIARELNLPVGTVAGAIGRKAPSVRKHPDAMSLQADLRRLYRIWVSLVDLFAGDKTNARIFLNAPNRHLENLAPIELIERGNLPPLESVVGTMTARQPT